MHLSHKSKRGLAPASVGQTCRTCLSIPGIQHKSFATSNAIFSLEIQSQILHATLVPETRRHCRKAATALTAKGPTAPRANLHMESSCLIKLSFSLLLQVVTLSLCSRSAIVGLPEQCTGKPEAGAADLASL